MDIETSQPAPEAPAARNWLETVPTDWDGYVAFRREACASREARESLRSWLADQQAADKLGLGLCAAGQPAAALRHLKSAEGDLCRLLLGWCLDRTGDPNGASAAWTALTASTTVANRAQLSLLDLHLRDRDAEGAAACLQALKTGNAPIADVTYAEGVVAEANGDHEGAVASWRLALQHDEAHADARFRLAHRLDLLGEDDEALELYLGLDAGDGATWIGALMNMGVLYEDIGDDRAALRCFRRVVEADPTNERARRYRADAESSMHQYYDESRERNVDKQNAVLRIPVTDFELSVRARNCLQRMNIHTLGDLVQRTETELLAFKNFGETSLQEVKEILSIKGLRLGMLPPSASGAGNMAVISPPAGEGDMNSMRITELDLSVRSRAALSTLGIATLNDLVNTTESTLLSCKNFGQTSLDEIKSKLSSLGLSLNA